MFTPEETGEILFCLRQISNKKQREMAKNAHHRNEIAARLERIETITQKLRGLRKVHPVFA